MNSFPIIRPRRLRSNPRLRDLIRETTLTINDMVLPLFIRFGNDIKRPIPSMPGHFQWSIDRLGEEIREIVSLNIPAVILFGIPEEKDAVGSNAYSDHGIIQRAVREIKSIAPDLLVITDVCLCEYTDHGHCGVIKNNVIDNDATLELLTKQAISHAKAGTDIVAPSGMIDGMVLAIRTALDAEDHSELPILSYTVKYASAMYGPFRDAAEGSPKFGDRKSHQMDPANANEALREVALDIQEGTDMLMVKPAHTYLDVIHRVKQAHPDVPLGAYHVSGEYAMIKAAAHNGWLDEQGAALEVLTAVKRAGADFIINYFAKELAGLW